MSWKIFLIKFFRNLVIGILFGVVALGAFGYFLAGREGMINMAYWGVALGLIGGFWAGIGVLFEARVWGDGRNISMFPEWNWFVKKSDDEKKDI
jgi:hypothetical protein